ncbi:uncharacterized acetyltransferase At3g50280 [Beta vulgaris subsp. vulgaris]|uniref:uncharacterized acetyltransferase At3g50280 n=1 Tax=Beta vulgaris subsp. vulgaris TaxID=3555 RepID=UPI0020374E01|nr:uncharacterized acetyltransferase At3g50280 [Beta vulgaris subsp. vulgaris]
MKKPYHLGPADLIMLSIDPIQKGLLFSLDSTNIIGIDRTTFLSNFVEKLKHSLSIALVHFYPLAGRFSTQKYVNENACSIYVEPNKGPGARFIHATAREFTVSDVISPNDVTIVRSFFDLGEKCLNYDGLTKALLSIQVTELLDGVFIGFSLNHSVVDGTSFVHFVNMFSHIFRNHDDNVIHESKIAKIPRVPIFNYRPWLSHDADNEDVAVIKFPVLDLDKLMNREYNPGPLRERIFHFSHTSMSKLKAKANQECGTENVILSFQSLSAFVWRSITRVRNLAPDQQTSCFFAIGARGRFDPPISDDYFGSFLYRAQYDCKVKELLDNGIGWNATKLHELIKTQDGKSILEFYEEFAKAPFVVPRGSDPKSLGENGVTMGGSARFDMYGFEFGLGRPLAVRMGYANKKNGKITASAGCQGGGSVDLEICLRPRIMSALEADQEFMSFVS